MCFCISVVAARFGQPGAAQRRDSQEDLRCGPQGSGKHSPPRPAFHSGGQG